MIAVCDVIVLCIGIVVCFVDEMEYEPKLQGLVVFII